MGNSITLETFGTAGSSGLPGYGRDRQSGLETPKSSDKIEKSKTSPKNHEDRLKKACAELESLFLYYMLKEMRKSINKSGFLSGGQQEEMYTSMFDAQLARRLSSGQGIGLSEFIKKQLDSGTDQSA